MPDDLVLTPDDTIATAQQLIDAGRPFHAHEVLEAAWKNAPAEQRELWRGLAQIAVGLTHARRGNDGGAVALLRRGADAVSENASGSEPRGLEPAAVAEAARDLAGRIERAGLSGVTDQDLRFRLTG
jgi:predicted metal-dependent hydrolase